MDPVEDLENLQTLFGSAEHPWMALALVAAAATLIALAVHRIVHRLLLRWLRDGTLPHELIEHTRRPMALVWPSLVLQVVWSAAPAKLPFVGLVQHATGLVLIFALTWAAIGAVLTLAGWTMSHDVNGARDPFAVRRVQTLARILARIGAFLIGLIGVAVALMTFPGVRQIGASMLASAGAAGLVVGFAAQPVLKNLLAGLQIAITQPIRIDDVVIVENEWGWIEEIRSAYVVVRIWDKRRLIVPLNYFIERPFQNWTRNSTQIIGSVFWWVDYRMPLAPMREELERLCRTAPEWDGELQLLQVTDTTDRAVQLRALVTAADSPAAWDLRCRIREGMIDFLQREYPQYLPRQRNEVSFDGPGAPERGPTQRS